MKRRLGLLIILAIALFSFILPRKSSVDFTSTGNGLRTHFKQEEKMKIEIWSDIMCPFCYIGKRKLEASLAQFANASEIEIEWHSFQLDPSIPDSVGNVNVYQYLADRKGITYNESLRMHENVVEMAKEAGLEYRFDLSIVANSFKAHRIIQMAKTKGWGDVAEERFFKAYFMEGADLSKNDVLLQLATEIGLNEEEVTAVLNSDQYTKEVKADILEAEQLGIRGVPFFVFNRKYAISGAQDVEVFLNTLEKSFVEWKSAQPVIELNVTDGPVCTPQGECK